MALVLVGVGGCEALSEVRGRGRAVRSLTRGVRHGPPPLLPRGSVVRRLGRDGGVLARVRALVEEREEKNEIKNMFYVPRLRETPRSIQRRAETGGNILS